mmetsp:Transcript_12606/g.18881  ORF Transcript_12606/g.18881 Transcript_12606/m.18881 type:complete len:241 (+) Transcript_12606:124-846(+)|eukprot:CAMPEP_0171461140 /NCGR_PEP_ID=MMETSP0945-20130129/5713_1 /TAXON_ID=109269 /ORGANISM="Vaucheria litorea, Strain CCMP2940" /LENGTH=240 /DNA_ID=CAMNT_0011987439 /DNA_START=211 /DNA_END=933 /DNA_ORIENTATION=+
MPLENEATETLVEMPLLSIKEVFVYRVPPLKSASGYRAEEWGLENPALSGSLTISRLNQKCYIKLFKSTSKGEIGAKPILFGKCTILLGNGRNLQHFVEHTVDSSRYFVLRCEEEEKSGKVAHVGIGFRERATSFDFKAVLDDFVRSEERSKKAQQLQLEVEDIEGCGDAGGQKTPRQDFSLQEGQTIHLSLPTKGRRRGKSQHEKGDGSFLVPPPGQKKDGPKEDRSVDDWGDFTVAEK